MWYQLEIRDCEHAFIETLNDAIELTNPVSITLSDQNDNPVLEPEPGTTPLWPTVVMHVLYSDEPAAAHGLEFIQTKYPALNAVITTLPDEDWVRTCTGDFKSQRFGKRLWICPSWELPPSGADDIYITLDPGLAFGTGTHPTTHLCLTWLDKISLSGKEIIDYGCGSGILAIAAIKLGAKTAYAIDIDPQALLACESNAAINHVMHDVKIVQREDIPHPIDIIIANILLAPLIICTGVFRELLNDNGLLAVSGILHSQEKELMDAYHPYFSLVEVERKDEWSLMVFQRLSSEPPLN